MTGAPEPAGATRAALAPAVIHLPDLSRAEPKKPRVPNESVLAVRVANLHEKDTLLADDPAKFFTEPHYNGFPAVLVRLAAIDVAELAEVITDAWRAVAAPGLVREFDRDRSG